MRTAPATPDQLRSALIALFPAFEAEIDAGASDGGDITFHSLMLEFTPFFGKNTRSFTEKQMRGLAELINVAIGSPGPLENAMSTCFLEHTRQIRVNRELGAAMTQRPRK